MATVNDPRTPLIHQIGPVPAHGITLTARSAILVDGTTGQVLWAKRANVRRRLDKGALQ